jgi:hypothetical protein
MGIDTSAVLIVGLEYKDVPKDKREAIDGLIDEDDMETASPHYDAERRFCIVGYRLQNEGEIDLNDLPAKVAEVKIKFFEATGLEGKLHLSLNVW